MQPTFDDAIEILEITDIRAVTEASLKRLARRARLRWHPDRVAHLKNSQITAEYTAKFQQVDAACELVREFLQGELRAGARFRDKRAYNHGEPEEILRRHATAMQSGLRGAWGAIKAEKRKWTQQQVVLSDGFRLDELLKRDLRDDIAVYSLISMFYGLVVFGTATAIATAVNPVLGVLAAIGWSAQAIACLLGLIPLSRLWLRQDVQEWMVKLINVGMGIYHWAEREAMGSDKWAVELLVQLPMLFAVITKYIVLVPAYAIANSFVGDKILGAVTQSVDYYAGAADWYIETLIAKRPHEMTREELFDLSHLCQELCPDEARHAAAAG